MQAEKFTRKRLLGSGGMGEVWLARDESLGRWVALKFLKGLGTESIARFEREARIAAGLTHPNIAAIYELGSEENQHFIAMQFVEGRTLASLPGRDPARFVPLIRDAARAVHFAHEQGIVHRDIKPDNLMVTPDGHLYVMDFGLARPTEGVSELSQSGYLVGTPTYMPPEQARGERAAGRSDVYSLGATLYSLLTGRPPHGGTSAIDILRRVVEEEPPRLRTIDRRIAPDLEAIVLKCLEKEPPRRYATANDLADDLDRYLEGEPIAARGQSPVYRLKRFLLKRKGILLAGAAGLVLAVVIAAIVLPGLGRESAARREGEQAITAEKKKAEALGELGAMWAQVVLTRQGLYRVKEDPRRITAELRKAVEAVSGYIKRHPEQPQGYYIRAKGWLYLDRIDAAQKDLEEAIRLDASFVPGYSLLARVLFEKYIDGMYRGDARIKRTVLAQLQPFLQKAQEALSKVGGKENESPGRWGLTRTADDHVTAVLTRCCLMAYVERDHAQAMKMLAAEQDRAPSEEFCRQLSAMLTDPAEQLPWILEAIDIMPHCARAYLDLGNIRLAMRDLPEALRNYTQAIEEDPELPLAYENRGSLLAELGRVDEALEDLGKAVALTPRVASCRRNLGVALMKAKKLDAAIQEFTLCLEIDPTYVPALALRGYAHYDKEEDAAALKDFARAIELDAEYAESYNGRGLVRMGAGELDGAIEDFTIFIRSKATLEGLINRAGAYYRKKNFEAALADYTKALEINPEDDEARRGQAGARQELDRN